MDDDGQRDMSFVTADGWTAGMDLPGAVEIR